MAIFKCKICGGTLEIDSAQSVATCEYCGTKQTLPKLDDDRRANLYDRANHFRRNNDFDKAKGIYEAILNENSTDAEAYWSIVLCHYGIEYVEDPSSHKRVPTVNRAQYTSIFDDEDYKSALANADSYQREIYEAEANAINEIQKGFLAISQKEEPFDVFICYKETDVSGRRTQDSVLATELYHELTREGFKVFFSRITLEDKLGIAYEPYIFAALNSAKVMVVVGTCPEHFNAVWVKNEWSRYLALIKNAAKKTLIPAYRNMDPYDLPEEFSHLQAQDMSKLGFMQDMIRGIKKIIEADAPKATTTETVNTTNVALHIAPLLKRAFMFLEDGEFDRADEFCEQVLNQDPENAEAYLGKLMVELRVKTPEQLKECELPFDNENYYRKAMRFADATLSKQLRGYISCINERNNLKKLTAAYNGCMLAMKSARSAVDYRDAAAQFNKISAFKDADSLAQLCLAKANEIEEKEKAEAARKAEEKRIADEQERLRRQRQAELDRIEAQKRSERNKKIAKIVLPIVAAIILFVIVLNTLIIPNVKYHNAVTLMNGGKYEEAVSIFEALDGYKDSNEQISNCKYKIALALVDEKKYEGAITILESLVGLENKQQIISVIQAIIQVEDRAFEAAIKTLLAAGVPVELTYQTAGGSLTDTQTLSLGYTLSLDDSILPLSTERSTTSEQTVFTLTQSSNFTGLKTPGRNGYRFVEWELDTYAYDVESKDATFTLSLKAKWSTKDYTVEYDLAGGSVQRNNIAEYDPEDEDFRLINPDRTGYTFAGWTGTGLSEPTIEVTVPTGSYGNRIYTATWTANEYTVTYDAAGGTVSSETQTVVYDTNIEYLIPERIGYKFLGWYENATKHENETWTLTRDLTLVAKWEIFTYEIKYELAGGTNHAENPKSYKVDSATITLKDPMRTGYTFTGWTYEGQSIPSKSVSIEKGSIGNKTFTANWSANLNTVFFDSNTGSGVMTGIQIETNDVKKLPECMFVKQGYTFKGWATSPDGSVMYSQGSSYTMGTDASYTLYAVWEVIEYSIVYVLDGGEASNISTYTVDDSIIVNNPSRDGYVFIGWTGTDLTSNTLNLVIEKGSVGDKEFIANWESYLIYEDNGSGYSVTGVVEKYQNIGEIHIPGIYNGKPVTHIEFLSECAMAKKLVIPNSVTTIALGALKGFSALEFLSLPFTGTQLDLPQDDYLASTHPFGWIFGTLKYNGGEAVIQGYQTYYIPSNLTNVYITNKVCGSRAFYGCHMIKNIAIPTDTEVIDDYTFAYCSSLKDVTDLSGKPISVKTIGEYAFSNCVNLETHISALQVEYYAFYKCEKMTKFTFLELPSDNFSDIDDSRGPNYFINRVGSYAFYGCSGLSNVYVLDNVAKIEWRWVSSSLLLNSSEFATYLQTAGNENVTYIRCCAWF